MIWHRPPKNIALAQNEIHLWQTRLDQPVEQALSSLSHLAQDEQARAMRFHFDKHRRDFVVARIFLRKVLQHYVNEEWTRIKFEYSAYGKPSLVAPERTAPLFFNLTHSDQLALLAVTEQSEIGIDIEHIRAVDDDVAEHFFSRTEVASLRALPVSLQNEAFFNCWTRKEAYIKARGEGLSRPLDQFDVSLSPSEPAAILAIRDGEDASSWRLEHLEPQPGYVGALAIRARNVGLKLWEWKWSDRNL